VNLLGWKYSVRPNPFFCYFGGKWRAAERYPLPIHQTIIEPFAGAAGYSVHYPELDVMLYDIDPIICGVWEYLIHTSAEEIRKLPIEVDHIDNINVSQEAKWLIGFWLNKASSSPRLAPSSWMKGGTRPNSHWGEVIRERIASQVCAIKHWKISCKSYEEIDNEKATWFIDPPYAGKSGKGYKCKFDAYEELAQWCQTRQGQVIVCEQAGANWLPFEPFAKIRTAGKIYSEEVIWKNLG